MRQTQQSNTGATGPQATWLRRNWQWFLPVMMLVLMSLCFTGGLLGVLDVFGRVRGSAVYQMALEQVRNDPRVLEQLGQPLDPGWLFNGEIEESNGSGTAEVVFNISGPGGEASVRVEAALAQGQWTIDFLHVYTRPRGGLGGKKDIAIIDNGEFATADERG